MKVRRITRQHRDDDGTLGRASRTLESREARQAWTPAMMATLLTVALLPSPAAVGAGGAVDGTGAWVQTAAMFTTDDMPVTDSDYGRSAAVDADRALIGAPGTGTVHFLERSSVGWRTAGALTGPPGFGTSLALDGATAVVGGENDAFVLERVGEEWVEVAHLVVPGTSEFGAASALDGDWLVVGDPGATDSAYLFEREASGWTLAHAFTVPGKPRFGAAVAAWDGIVAVGAPYATAYVFELRGTSWTMQAIAGPVGFGSSVALGDGRLVVGAPHSELARVFSRGAAGWIIETDLEAPEDLVRRAFFATTVAVTRAGDRVVIGAPWDDATPPGTPTSPVPPPQFQGVGVPQPGAVHVFDADASGWFHSAKLVPAGVGEAKQFGSSLAISPDGAMIAAGAPGKLGGLTWAVDLTGSSWHGDDATYFFERVETLAGVP